MFYSCCSESIAYLGSSLKILWGKQDKGTCYDGPTRGPTATFDLAFDTWLGPRQGVRALYLEPETVTTAMQGLQKRRRLKSDTVFGGNCKPSLKARHLLLGREQGDVYGNVIDGYTLS